MAKTVMLVFAIISLVLGAILMTFWTFMLVIDISLKAQYPGATMNPESLVIFYLALTLGIVFIAVSILLFYLRGRKTD